MKVNFYFGGELLFKKKMSCIPHVGERIEYIRCWLEVTERLFHLDKRIAEVDIHLKNVGC